MNFFGFRKLVFLAMLVVIGLVIAAYLGLFDWQTASTSLRVAASNAASEVKSGASVDLSSPKAGGNAIANAQACRANLQRIESAKRTIASKMGITISESSWDAVLKEMGGKMPVCPSGGKYSLGNNQSNARCSVGSNSTTDKADDHLLASF